MAAIIKGTTPTITFVFSDVSVSDIVTAIMTVKCGSEIVIEKELSSASVGEDTLSWRLTQDETLSAMPNAEVMLNWVVGDGTRGASERLQVVFSPNHIEEVI